MNNLVNIKNGQAVTDSLTVAEVFGKRHSDVTRDIEVQINKLFQAGESEFSERNFAESKYYNRGKEYSKYEMTEDGFAIVAMSYVTPEAMKFKVKFLEEFKRIKEELQKRVKPLTEREQIINSMKLTIEMAEEFGTIKKDVDELKDKVENRITLDYGQQRALNNVKKNRVYQLWNDGKINRELLDTKHKVFAAIGRDLKDAFAVNSYRDIRQQDFEEAVNFLKYWRPRLV